MDCKLGVAVAVIALVRVCSALLACGLWWAFAGFCGVCWFVGFVGLVCFLGWWVLVGCVFAVGVFWAACLCVVALEVWWL